MVQKTYTPSFNAFLIIPSIYNFMVIHENSKTNVFALVKGKDGSRNFKVKGLARGVRNKDLLLLVNLVFLLVFERKNQLENKTLRKSLDPQ